MVNGIDIYILALEKKKLEVNLTQKVLPPPTFTTV